MSVLVHSRRFEPFLAILSPIKQKELLPNRLAGDGAHRTKLRQSQLGVNSFDALSEKSMVACKLISVDHKCFKTASKAAASPLNRHPLSLVLYLPDFDLQFGLRSRHIPNPVLGIGLILSDVAGAKRSWIILLTWAWKTNSPKKVLVSTTTVSDGEIRDCSCFLCQEN